MTSMNLIQVLSIMDIPMPEHNDTISRAEAVELGWPPGKYIYKLCINGCGNGLWMYQRMYTSSRICRDCLINQLHGSKVGKANGKS